MLLCSVESESQASLKWDKWSVHPILMILSI